ncbi:hypothetical protein [Shewanella sp. UCD-KL12]|uniref:hypothetical protein n=1 Tax=Shewanella sp. UCD-KL12 TaxID=1917163 RepID=UPI0009703041|nr:hypothetical protein [Shewanella sp. UCD-KL12]
MTNSEVVALVLIAGALQGCREDVTFQLDSVAEVNRKSVSTHKEVDGVDVLEKAISECYLRVYAVNHLDYGVKVAPLIKVNVNGVEHTLKVNSWGDDWEYLVAGKKDEEYKQKLCFKERDSNPLSCAELAKAIQKETYSLELNRCEKIDQSPASCNMEIKLSKGGVSLRSPEVNEQNTNQLAD